MLRSRPNQLLALSLLLALGLGFVGLIFYRTPTFEACAQFQSTAPIPVPAMDCTLCIFTPFEQIKSQKVLNRALDDLTDTGAFPSDKSEAYHQLVRRIELQSRGPRTIRIFFRDEKPALATMVVNSVASNFVVAAKSTGIWTYIPENDPSPKRAAAWLAWFLSLVFLATGLFFRAALLSKQERNRNHVQAS